MTRKPNTTKNGGSWTLETKQHIWNKAEKIPNHNENVWRKDNCGSQISWNEFGNRKSPLGWEIDHINPVANGGEDDLSNLQALNWKNNAEKSDKLDWECS